MKKFALLLALVLPLSAQEQTRAEQIAADRDTKERILQSEEPSRIERKLDWLKDSRLFDQMNDGFHGLHAKLGGLVPGGGFAVGPEFSRQGLWNGKLDIRTGIQASTRRYIKQDLQITMPGLFNNKRLSFDFFEVHHNYPSLNYYGPGPDSNRTGRSDYRHEDTALDATLSYKLARNVQAGASTGFVFNNVGAGTDSRYVSTEQIYNVNGVTKQSNYFTTGAFVQYDTRDFAPGPRSGGNYIAQFRNYNDRTYGQFDFKRLQLEGQQYLPFFNKRRVIALRAKSVTTFSDTDVPFYMQPSLGGSDDLRGFRPFRFRGNNLLLMNAEYRYEVFSGLDMAVFADAGKVYMKKSALDLHNLESNVGFGFRFNARNTTFMRIDVGFSHEGYLVSVKFNDLFRKGPVHTSSVQGDF